jgi:Rieske Fe-S protein
VKLDDSYLARRRFLCGMLGGGVAALGAGLSAPLVQYAGNFHEEPPPDFLELAAADCDLTPGTSKIIRYGRIPVLLLKPPGVDEPLRIFVATCTHLNCTVCYRAAAEKIYCACHEGYYDLDGQVLAGPPPRALQKFYHRRVHGRLFIALEREKLEKASLTANAQL